MAGYTYAGPLGCCTNQPEIDQGTNCLSNCSLPGVVREESVAVRILREHPPALLTSVRQAGWISELFEAYKMFIWWRLGSPTGNLEFGPEDEETKHMKNTPAYQEARQVYREWVQRGRPKPEGEFKLLDVPCCWVPSRGYLYVKGRWPNRSWLEGPAHPLWAFTGNFAIRFTESGWPSAGHVDVELANPTSFASFLHAYEINDASRKFLDRFETNSPVAGILLAPSALPQLYPSWQIYRFKDYIPTDTVKSPTDAAKVEVEPPHKVKRGDSLEKIAKDRYGDALLWPIIWKYKNNYDKIGPDPHKIQVDRFLDMPSKAELAELTIEQIAKARRTAQQWRHVAPVHVTPLR